MAERRAGSPEGHLRATMADVARLAGVSPTTVSLVVNARPGTGISDETRERVLAAVKELHYRPNRAAANLRLRRSHVLGFHVSASMLKRRSLFAMSFLPFLIDAAEEHGYQVMAFTDQGDQVTRLADLVRTQAVDGFVLTDSTVDDPRARYLAEAGAPFAAMGRLAADLPQSWVDIDNAAAMRIALDHLTSLGHDDVAFVIPDQQGYWWDDRLDGYRAWAQERGVADPEGRVVRAPMDQIRNLVVALLSGHPRPSGLLAAGDAVVVPCYRAVSDVGLKVGRDLAVVGFDPLLWMLDPPLTTVTIPMDAIARVLVSRLLDQVESGPDERPGTILPTGLAVRESA